MRINSEGGAELSAPELNGLWFEAGEFFAASFELPVQAESRSAIAAPPAATTAHPARRDVRPRGLPFLTGLSGLVEINLRT